MEMTKRVVYIALVLIIMSSCTGVVTTKPSPDAEDKPGLLRERAAANWEAMKARDWGKVYDMYDPFYRALVGRDWFVGRGVPIYYKSFEIGEVDIKGNVASVAMKVVYGIENVGKSGQPIKREDAETYFAEKWLFVDNDWYKQYEDRLSGGTFAYY
jgi:hypothetical protein